jgi:hypothetical protein
VLFVLRIVDIYACWKPGSQPFFQGHCAPVAVPGLSYLQNINDLCMGLMHIGREAFCNLMYVSYYGYTGTGVCSHDAYGQLKSDGYSIGKDWAPKHVREAILNIFTSTVSAGSS